jgi:uncharacterized repeat protein (TIGR01451 family)
MHYISKVKHLTLIYCIVVLGVHASYAQTDLQLRAHLASDFSNHYGETNCTTIPADLIGMSVYQLWIDTDGDFIKPFRIWGDQTHVMEFVAHGSVHNNTTLGAMDCMDAGSDLGWLGGAIAWVDTWISLGGWPSGFSNDVFFAGCFLNGTYTANYGNNPTVNPFLVVPGWVIAQNPTAYPLGQTMTTTAGPVSLTNWNAVTSPTTPMTTTNSVYIGQIVTDGPMVVRVNFDYFFQDVLYEHQWVNDPGLVMSFGYCFDPNACNYSPDFEVVGTGYESCEYNSCTPCGGCTNEAATNYNQYAELDNGTCFFPGCTDPEAENYDPIAYEVGVCVYSNGSCADAHSVATDVDPILVGFNAAAPASDALFCFDPEPESALAWFSFEATNENMYVYSAPGSGGMLDLAVLDACEGTLLDCVQNTSLNYLGLTALTIGHTYYVGFRGEQNLVFQLAILTGTVGCNDQNALNYVPLVDVSFGCIYAGCTDPEACNYDAVAHIDDGSCFQEGAVLKGSVYRDFNSNNFPSNNERVANYPLTILPGNDIVYTNAQGYYHYTTTSTGPYTIIADQDMGNYTPEFTETEVAIEGICTDETRNIRLISTSEGPNYTVSHPNIYYIFCAGPNGLSFSVTNSGTVTISAEVTVTVSGIPDFSFTSMPPGAQLIGTNQFTVTSAINAGVTRNFSSVVELISPALPNLSVTYDVNFFDQNNALFTSDSYTVPAHYFCSFDPNNKVAFPEGYAAPEFIANERITYLINFQNTGNYPAVNVLIRDTLDLDVLDLSTFEYIESSHSHFTTLSSDGVLEFFYENIYLPDSTSNEPESKGWVRFSIAPHQDLPHMTQINNEARIYFDINDPIITNTESRTIYLCGTEAEVSALPEFLCAGDEAQTAFLNPYLDSTLWYINGEPVSTSETLLLPQSADGLITVSWTGSNPLCTTSNSAQLIVEVTPELFYDEETGVLFTEANGSYQWYSSDGLIDGASESFFSPPADGNYYVVVTTENGCVYQTSPLTITKVGFVRPGALVVYPNPTSGLVVIDWTNAAPYTVQVVDMKGALLLSEYTTAARHLLDLSRLEAGSYIIRLIDENGQQVVQTIHKTN